jgi:protein XRP2
VGRGGATRADAGGAPRQSEESVARKKRHRPRPHTSPLALPAAALPLLPSPSESLTLKNLKNCSVYILDHSSEVEASDCVGCELFIGPVDGPALFSGCTGCTAAVAAQQFQARRCGDTSFSLFCGTAPSVSACADLTFTCWSGAYPGLAAHFRAAGLDPGANAWDKVHDTDAEKEGGGEGGGAGAGVGGGATPAAAPSFKISRARGAWWEVPLAGEGGGACCENPVPAADGSLYEPTAGAAAGGEDVEGGGGGGGGGGGSAPPPIPPLPLDAGAAVALTPAASMDAEPAAAPPAAAVASNGGCPPAAPGGGGGDHPRVAALKAAARDRLAAQEAAEAASRAATMAAASDFLASFYKARDADKAARAAAAEAAPGNLAAAAARAAAAGKPAGDTVWERIASLVDLDAPPVGSDKAVDLGRAKAVLATARAKNLAA